jgi:hypothetical protein
VLGECWQALSRQHLAQQARLKLDEHAVNGRAGPAPMVESNRIIAKLDADFGQNAIGCLFDPDQVVFRQDVIGRDVADDVGAAQPLRTVRSRLTPRAAPGPRPFGFGNFNTFVCQQHQPLLQRAEEYGDCSAL